jgi:prolyl-tRNA synthetase
MKDSYSFDLEPSGLDVSFDRHYEAYRRIFTRCGLDFIAADADSGAMGGTQSTEFMVPSDAGEDLVVVCGSYAANLEKAVAHPTPPAVPDSAESLEPELVHTPGRKTIAEVSGFLGLPETSQIKSLVMVADGAPVLALLRGDHQLNETKFAAALKAREVRPAFPHEIRQWFGADPGSLGPVGMTNMRVLADNALEGRTNMVSGANRDDYHLRNVTPGEDFEATYVDLRHVVAGDACIECGQPVAIKKCIEIGHIFKLGYKYSDSMGVRVLGPEGAEVTPIMGCYGIGIERILSAAIEQWHDADGMILPPSIAPFEVVVTPVNNADAAQKQAALDIYQTCLSLGLDALLDDRDERPGVKFKDADLIGIPYRVTVGKKLVKGIVELTTRKGKQSEDVLAAEAAGLVAKRCR